MIDRLLRSGLLAVMLLACRSATAISVPDAPTAVIAAPGDKQATVSWKAPANNGGSAITAYTVTSSSGGFTAQALGNRRSARIDGLSNGTAYTFTVYASNAAGNGVPSQPSAAVTPSASVAFPVVPSANGRYLQDKNGRPFRIQGDSMWDAPFNLNLTDLRAYLDDRQAKGFNALFTYVSNPVAYFAGSSAPWALQLGGPSVPTALPFAKNLAGGDWDGDPSFTNHDADFSSPNDSFFAWMSQVVDEAASRGMLVLMAPMYLGYNHGATDGWSQTLMRQGGGGAAGAHNTICHGFGLYLANGHGAFPGFKGKQNLIWVIGGDTLPANGSEEALRSLDVLKGLKDGGDTNLVTTHWQHDYLSRDQSDIAPYVSVQSAYTHGPYPAVGPTYAETRALYSATPTLPVFLIETNYWGEHGATQDQVRYFGWGALLSGVGGYTVGFGPFWGFAVSADGVSRSRSGGDSTSWLPNTAYNFNQYVTSDGSWWRLIAPPGGGTSGSTKPTGTGPTFQDKELTWSYLGPANWRTLLNEPAILDMQRMGAFFDSVGWQKLVPSGLGGLRTVVTGGGGTFATWSDGQSESGGLDWVASAADPDGTLIVAYVPSAHSGSITIDMTLMSSPARARWYNPANGSFTVIGTFPNSGRQAFTVPGSNDSGNDWVLVLDIP